MRPILLITLALAFTASCTNNFVDPSQDGGFIYYNLDFKKYTDQDFQITIEKPYGEYESIGLVRVDLHPEIREFSYSQTVPAKNGILEIDSTSYWIYKEYDQSKPRYFGREIIDAEKAIDELYQISKKWGANAIVNFDISRQNNVITVSGFAINKSDTD